MFWSSVELTGNQTLEEKLTEAERFWSSAELTGNQTIAPEGLDVGRFWSSVELTGNQTGMQPPKRKHRFGAVSN